MDDTLLWWIVVGYDAPQHDRQGGRRMTGSERRSRDHRLLEHAEDLSRRLFGDFTYTPEQHNGYPTNEVVMSKANSSRMGAFELAPGYGA